MSEAVQQHQAVPRNKYLWKSLVYNLLDWFQKRFDVAKAQSMSVHVREHCV